MKNPQITYPAISSALSHAVDESIRPAAMKGAITAMQLFPEACARIRCFNDILWEIIQDTLNAKTPIKDPEGFELACALLESMDERNSPAKGARKEDSH